MKSRGGKWKFQFFLNALTASRIHGVWVRRRRWHHDLPVPRGQMAWHPPWPAGAWLHDLAGGCGHAEAGLGQFEWLHGAGDRKIRISKVHMNSYSTPGACAIRIIWQSVDRHAVNTLVILIKEISQKMQHFISSSPKWWYPQTYPSE